MPRTKTAIGQKMSRVDRAINQAIAIAESEGLPDCQPGTFAEERVDFPNFAGTSRYLWRERLMAEDGDLVEKALLIIRQDWRDFVGSAVTTATQEQLRQMTTHDFTSCRDCGAPLTGRTSALTERPDAFVRGGAICYDCHEEVARAQQQRAVDREAGIITDPERTK